MSAAQSGDDDEPPLARRRGTGRDAGAQGAGAQGAGAQGAGAQGTGEQRSQRSLFQERDDDFEQIRDIIAKASRPGAVAADAAAGSRLPPQGGAAARPGGAGDQGGAAAIGRSASDRGARGAAAGQPSDPGLAPSGLKRGSSTAAEAARSVLRASGAPAPVPPSPPAQDGAAAGPPIPATAGGPGPAGFFCPGMNAASR